MLKEKGVQNRTQEDIPGYFRQVARQFLKNRMAKFGATIVLVVCFMALFCRFLAPYDPYKLNVRESFSPPSSKHLLGTDSYGRDIFSRILYGARVSMKIGLEVLVVAGLVGTLLGLLAGWNNKLDGFLMRIMDGLMAFPGILLALAIRAALGPREFNLVIALSVTQLPQITRIVRSSVLKVREMGYVRAARGLGASDSRIMVLHVLPNILAPLIIQMSFSFASVILSEAGLSFVGVGAPPPSPSWGSIIADGRDYVRYAPWITVAPGIIIIIVVLGLNLLGDGLRDILDPKMQRRG